MDKLDKNPGLFPECENTKSLTLRFTCRNGKRQRVVEFYSTLKAGEPLEAGLTQLAARMVGHLRMKSKTPRLTSPDHSRITG